MRKLLLATGALVAGAMWWRRRRLREMRAARPADVRFMYAMHNAFRRDLARLERARSDPWLKPVSRGGWNVFREELEFHHRAEDDDLWPVVRARADDADAHRIMDEMVVEHARVVPALAAVANAFDNGGDLDAAVEGLTQSVREHLDHEERFALPVVQQNLSDADWHRYMSTERRKRGRKGAQFLCWVLDDATPADATAVLSEVPVPGRLVYRFVMKPRYDKRRLWADETRLVTTSERQAVLVS